MAQIDQRTPNGNGSRPVIEQIAVPKGTRVVFETLLKSANALAKDEAIGSLLNSIDKVPALEMEVKRREQKAKEHDLAMQEALRIYNQDRDQWTTTEKEFLQRVEKLQQQCRESEKAAETLKTAESRQGDRIKSLEALMKEKDQDIQLGHQKIQGLINSITVEKQKNVSLNSMIQENKARIERLEAENSQQQKECAMLRNKAQWSAQQLQNVAELTVPLHDDSQIIQKMDAIWSDAVPLICSTFYHDLALDDPKTKAFWTRAIPLDPSSKPLPMPQSNTSAAKRMRCVFILASLARTFADHLFQPTYFLTKDSGIRSLLSRQAQAHSAKESAIRASFQALLLGEQDAMSAERINDVCEEVMTLVGGLLASDQQPSFRDRLRLLAEEAGEVWRGVCRFKESVEPRFDVLHYDDWFWRELSFESSQAVISEQASAARASRDEAVFAIFPRLYTSTEEGENPESHGILFMWSQARVAENEMEAMPSNSRSERRKSTRNRKLRAGGAIDGPSSVHGRQGARPFLGQEFGED